MPEHLPGLGVSERSVFLNIKNSKIMLKTKDGGESFYNYISGKLVKIKERAQEINGNTIVFYDFHIENGDVKYKLSTIKSSSNSRSIINCLMSVDNLAIAEIKIAPYENKNGYTNIAVYANGQKVDWLVPAEKLPRVEEVVLKSGKSVRDSGELDAFFEKFVSELNARLDKELDPATGRPAEPVYDGDDLPEYMNNGNTPAMRDGGLG